MAEPWDVCELHGAAQADEILGAHAASLEDALVPQADETFAFQPHGPLTSARRSALEIMLAEFERDGAAER